MPQFEEVRFQRFDQVNLRTTKNVKYLSAPPGTKVAPDGAWSVVAVVGDDLLVVKRTAIIRIPATDVLKVASYDINEITKPFGRFTDGEG